MRAEELSVGNWVYSTFCKQPCKVTNIGLTEHGYCSVDVSTVIGLKDIASLTPIPLTAEILEKNGFEMADDTYTRPTVFYFSKDRRVQVSNLTNSGDGYWCVHVDNEDFETIGSCDVQYVHGMQNFLRLCKYELDLKI